MSRLRQLFRIGAGFYPYIRRPLTADVAFDQLRQRVAERERRFLELARLLIYSKPGGPYARLLAHAGCAYADLEHSVRAEGLEPALEKLRQAGVHLSVEEYKSKTPICRNGITIETKPED